MISTSDVALYYSSRKLFDEVSIKFDPGNCYGIIGANGAGKSSFLKILSGEIEPSKGDVNIPANIRLSILKQDHFQFDEVEVQKTVILGNAKLVEIMDEKDKLYQKPDFSEADGMRTAELETQFGNMGGWEAETDSATLLNALGITSDQLNKKVKELNDNEKVKVLLAQALFGNPDVLLLDEPTNHLDLKSIRWLENYLLDYDKTVIVISHDRHFLNKICTHMVDIDYGKITSFVGNYDFWYQATTLAKRLKANENKKNEEKAKELKAFIQRFSANAAKSKQATGRKKQLEKLDLDDIPVSTRRIPHIDFKPEREAGDILLVVENLSKTIDGKLLLKNISFELQKGDKVIFISKNPQATSALMNIISGDEKADQGDFKWGVTTSQAYLPKDHDPFFEGHPLTLIDWLRQYSEDKSEQFIRKFLGKMLFSGEETLKMSNVLSGGEKVRCLLAKMMLQNANVLVLDGPTNHLDLESISSLNSAAVNFPGTILLTTHDQELAHTVANRVIKINEDGSLLDYQNSYQRFLEENES